MQFKVVFCYKLEWLPCCLILAYMLLNYCWVCFLQECNVFVQRNAAARRRAKKQKEQGFSEFLSCMLQKLTHGYIFIFDLVVVRFLIALLCVPTDHCWILVSCFVTIRWNEILSSRGVVPTDPCSTFQFLFRYCFSNFVYIIVICWCSYCRCKKIHCESLWKCQCLSICCYVAVCWHRPL